MRVTRDRQRASAPPVLKFIITVASLAVISFGIALVWQNAQDSIIEPKAPRKQTASEALESGREESVGAVVFDSEPGESGGTDAAESAGGESEPEIPGDAQDSVDTENPEDAEASDGPEESAADESGDGILPKIQSTGYARAAINGAVALNEKTVGYDYFSDAIFFGDSISTGIPLYMKTTVPDAAVVAVQGVSTMGANTSQCIDVNGVKLTMIDAAKTKGDRKKVYIMLGANGLDLDEKNFIDGYKTFIGSVKELYPEAVIYVQSMLPVTANVNKVYPSKNINNSRISEYNGLICKMANELGVYYVDVAQCMVDENGMLPHEASPFDGMHLTPEYYMRWFDYLRNHTVK